MANAAPLSGGPQAHARILLTLADAGAPGLVTGLALTGSAALGDWREDLSDLNFVAVLRREPRPADLRALARLHRLYGRVPGRPPLDGVWLDPAALAGGPDAWSARPVSQRGRFIAESTTAPPPVIWAALTSHGAWLRTPETLQVWDDPPALRRWLKDHLSTHWRSWRRRAGGLGPQGLALLGRAVPAWGVLGASRVWMALTRSEIASKTAAGQAARAAFPEHGAILDEALAHRAGEPPVVASAWGRRRQALACVDSLLDRATAP
ncbi:MAG: DUF4111 domain-containing protein [Phenylobacterium sp.]|uniref:aminoglycoside adenylyltransferase domain-containing protein n=1 Tax=Phenylobacterium sp. TaxID=1871053 RepID=UPI002715BDEE|nr:aminoglycoside adenylyltransferase domain-containing protein [Phenylobacterium sp.]MDO8901749.1 DUF4111 domain-containing protein [Phenylobacterium sp.]